MRILAPVSLLLLSSAASAAPLTVGNVTASSTYPAQDGVKYEAKQLVDQKQSLAWFEGDDGSGLGAWVELSLEGNPTITGFKIWNGYQLTWDMFQRNNRVKDLEVEVGGKEFTFVLEDTFGPQEIRLPEKVAASTMKFRIKGIHNGSTFNDTAISEIMPFDDSPSGFVTPTASKSSSAYPDDSDGTYGTDNVMDGMKDTMWCEGSKDGDGTGEWIEFDLGGSTKVSAILFNNGNAGGFSSFMNANSATKATVSFSDGSSQQIELKPSMMDQTVSIGPKTTSKVR
ncbi:MAG: discoidin domain-containing protein, partial [Alphaproteobacteria bacterium]|nr:discoidin domain-containing protein [Alphaproteobacteria bacterium]